MPSCEKDTPAPKRIITTAGDIEKVRWLLQQTKLMNQKIDTNLRFRSFKNKDGTHGLSISNISESTLAKLIFVTSTDTNSSLGVITKAAVFLLEDPMNNSISVPGFLQNMALVFSQANTKAWQNGDKYFTPFNNPFLQPITETPMSVSDYVDMLTGSVPEVTHTYGKGKFFQIVFNSAIAEQSQLRNGGVTPDGVKCVPTWPFGSTYTCYWDP